jgi:hypothetical protein
MDLKDLFKWVLLGTIVCAVVVVCIFGGIWLFSKPSYETVTKFTYSVDGGTSYREGLQEINVGETYYLCIEMQVVASKDRNAEEIVAQVIIPKTKIVDCYLDDYPGTKITGAEDSINGIITYEFNLPSSTEPSKFRVIFECVASQEGRYTIEVKYDDRISDAWDKTETIKYVNS